MSAAVSLSATTDSSLAIQIRGQLAETKRASLGRLSVAVHDGAVILCGSVGSFYEKQIAIQICRLFAGTVGLIDAAQVAVAHYPPPSPH
jgi:osmotically-inducible protein OsmY